MLAVAVDHRSGGRMPAYRPLWVPGLGKLRESSRAWGKRQQRPSELIPSSAAVYVSEEPELAQGPRLAQLPLFQLVFFSG